MLFTREQEKLSQTLYLSHGGSFIVQVTHSGKQSLNEWSLSPEHFDKRQLQWKNTAVDALSNLHSDSCPCCQKDTVFSPPVADMKSYPPTSFTRNLIPTKVFSKIKGEKHLYLSITKHFHEADFIELFKKSFYCPVLIL